WRGSGRSMKATRSCVPGCSRASRRRPLRDPSPFPVPLLPVPFPEVDFSAPGLAHYGSARFKAPSRRPSWRPRARPSCTPLVDRDLDLETIADDAHPIGFDARPILVDAAAGLQIE